MLRAPDKRLRYSKQHFQGYFLQLHAYLRKDSDTDDYLDGVFTNPITDLIDGHARELKRGADHRDETIMAVVTQLTSLYQEFLFDIGNIQASADYNQGFTAPYLSAPFRRRSAHYLAPNSFWRQIAKIDSCGACGAKIRMAAVFKTKQQRTDQ